MPTLLTPLRARWQRLLPRERRALAALAATLAPLVAWGLVLQPQARALEAAQQRYLDELLLQHELQRLPTGAARAPGPDAEALPGLLARSSAEAGLNVERMDNQGPGRVELSLEGGLRELLDWLERLAAQGVEATALDLQVDAEAQARARLALELE
ncbi:type II secretion system protein GspM [Metapseudomonas furukawaii]